MARVKPSPTGAVTGPGTRLKAEGRDIISLGTGEPDFDTPQPIKDAAIKAIQAGQPSTHRSTARQNSKRPSSASFERDNELAMSQRRSWSQSGAKQALFNLCLAVLGPGDEAIIPCPVLGVLPGHGVACRSRAGVH